MPAMVGYSTLTSTRSASMAFSLSDGSYACGGTSDQCAGDTARSGKSAPTLDEVDRAGAAEQPHLLLRLIIARLHEQQRLPPAGALTFSELERAARLKDRLDRERLAALTAACERARFAEDATAASLAGAAARGRELLHSLETPCAQPAGSS